MGYEHSLKVGLDAGDCFWLVGGVFVPKLEVTDHLFEASDFLDYVIVGLDLGDLFVAP